MHYHPLTSGSGTPFGQIGATIWPATTGVVLAIALIVTICVTTDGKNTNTNVWTANASVLVAVGGIVLKGSVGSLVGIAIYHRLWLQLGRHDDKAGRSNGGLTVKQIESYHLASRLAAGMLIEPSKSIAWACGMLCLLLTAAIVPLLQYGMDIKASSIITPTTVAIHHAQLDDRMAIRSGAQGSPDNVTPNVLRAATRALFGAESAFVYKQMNLTGTATFSDVQYADVDCNIEVTQGRVNPTSRTDWYYNITFDPVTPPWRSGDYNSLYALAFTSVLNNNTHFLRHTCQIRAAIGSCSTYLNNGTGLTKDLHCTRNAWMSEEQLPATPTSPAVGFFAIATAFFQLFEGAASTTLVQGRPFQNSTFVAATARYVDRMSIGMPADLISHVQRTLWHAAINAAPIDMPELEVGGQYDLNSTVDMTVDDETPVLLVSIDFKIIATVLGAAFILGTLAVLYLITANNQVPGRLMRDSLVHTLSVAARVNSHTQCASAINLQDSSHNSLENVLRDKSQMRLRAVLLADPDNPEGGPCLVLERASQEPVPMTARTVQVRPSKTSPLIWRDPSPRPGPPSSRRSNQMRLPSVSPGPSIYRYQPADFHGVSRQYRIHSEPDVSAHLPTHLRTGYQSQDYYEPPSVQCHCNDPAHHH